MEKRINLDTNVRVQTLGDRTVSPGAVYGYHMPVGHVNEVRTHSELLPWQPTHALTDGSFQWATSISVRGVQVADWE